MMPARYELKNLAKNNLRANYWPLVIVSFISLLILGMSVSGNTQIELGDNGMHIRILNMYNYHSSVIPPWAYALVGLFAITGVVATVVYYLLLTPIDVGCHRYYLRSMDEIPEMTCVLDSFRNGYGSTVLTMFLRRLFNALWFCLLVIPGFVKMYEYRLIPYLLAEHPDMDWRDAFRISRELMYGRKLDAFLLDLSFLGWNILSTFTLNLSGIFYSNPYQNMTNAQFYRAACRAHAEQ